MIIEVVLFHNRELRSLRKSKQVDFFYFSQQDGFRIRREVRGDEEIYPIFGEYDQKAGEHRQLGDEPAPGAA